MLNHVLCNARETNNDTLKLIQSCRQLWMESAFFLNCSYFHNCCKSFLDWFVPDNLWIYKSDVFSQRHETKSLAFTVPETTLTPRTYSLIFVGKIQIGIKNWCEFPHPGHQTNEILWEETKPRLFQDSVSIDTHI